jgi:hypothetical protein
MQRLERHEPLPHEMQGRWRDINDATSELIIDGGQVTCLGQPVAYDYKLVGIIDDALTVSLRLLDDTNEDAFQRTNITELVITPEGEFHAYNVKFAIQLERAEA